MAKNYKTAKENDSMARRKTNKEFKQEVLDLVGNEYEFLEEYKNTATKILCKHDVCGYEWNIAPSHFLRGTRCPKCVKKDIARGMRKTNKVFIEDVYNQVNDGYVFLEEYVDMRTSIKCKHKKCGHEYFVTPGNFLQGRRCPLCLGGSLKSNEQFQKDVFNLTRNEYEFLEEYINIATKIDCKHNKCGHVWEIRPNDFLQGTRCPRCNTPNYNRDTEHFKKEIYELVDDEYELLDGYINTLHKVKIKHNDCGHVWKVFPHNFLSGSRCPQCCSSKGEQTINNYLKNNKVSFQREYTFRNLTGIGDNLLRYDFAILNNFDGNLLCLVEYDGEFHFKEFYKNQNFKRLKIHDERKNQYCKDNNIPLLRIPYWDFDNIEEILGEWLINL